MAEYDVRQFDKQAEIIGSRVVTCENDSDAVGVAYATVYAALKTCHAVEVWSDGRMVARMPVHPVLLV